MTNSRSPLSLCSGTATTSASSWWSSGSTLPQPPPLTVAKASRLGGRLRRLLGCASPARPQAVGARAPGASASGVPIRGRPLVSFLALPLGLGAFGEEDPQLLLPSIGVLPPAVAISPCMQLQKSTASLRITEALLPRGQQDE